MTSEELQRAAKEVAPVKRWAASRWCVTFQERALPGGVEINVYCANCRALITSSLVLDHSKGEQAEADQQAIQAHHRRCHVEQTKEAR